MSYQLKRPSPIDPRRKRDERQVKVMASGVRNQKMLDKLLEGASPLDRAAMVARLRPYLPFTPENK